MPNYSGIYDMVVKNLEKMGYEVTHIKEKQFEYKNIQEKIFSFYKKNIVGDKDYKNTLRKKRIEEEIIYNTDLKNTFFDYTLIIHPSNYTVNAINYLKKISNKVLAYHWEGFSRFNVPEKVIEAFDTFGVFDKDDYEKYKTNHKNLILTHSFYFDFITPVTKKEKNIDLFYIGAYFENRYENLKNVLNASPKKLNNYLRLVSKKRIENRKIIIDDVGVTYETNLKLTSRAKYQIDMKLKAHNGLSLRFFEALHFSQKVITDNHYVKKMDFYNPNNILVIDKWSDLNENLLSKFIDLPYIEIDTKIKDKYSFKEWFKKISGYCKK